MYFKYVIFFSRSVLKILMISEELRRVFYFILISLWCTWGIFVTTISQMDYRDTECQMGSKYLSVLGMRCKNIDGSPHLAMWWGWKGEAASQLRIQEENQAVLVEGLQPLFPIFHLINVCLGVNPYEGSRCSEVRNLGGIQWYARYVKMMRQNLNDLGD